MPESTQPPNAAIQARLAAHWLALGSSIDIASLALTILAAAALLGLDFALVVHAILLLSVMAGLAEKFFALRVAFDQRIFCDWARRWEMADGISPVADLAAFDTALAAAGLRSADNPGSRPLHERIRGAIKLLTYQAALFIIQSLAILAAILCRHGS